MFTNNEFKNNLIHTTSGAFDLYNSGASATQYDQQYNCYYNIGEATPTGVGNISVNPFFTDPENNDFTLSGATTASVYDGGTDLAEVIDDFIGVTRESTKYSIGAYERDA